eukprot:1598545-Ditylum_brightwellii.AAC.1
MNGSVYEATVLAKNAIQNADKTVQCAQNGNNGYLGIAMPDAQYTTRIGAAVYVTSLNYQSKYVLIMPARGWLWVSSNAHMHAP